MEGLRKHLPQTTQKYVAASRALQAGEVLKPENLTLVEWPAKMPLEGAFTRIEELSGRAVIYPVAARQPVLDGYLAVVGSGIGLTVKIPEGMRAASVRSDEVIGCGGVPVPRLPCGCAGHLPQQHPAYSRPPKSFCRMSKFSRSVKRSSPSPGARRKTLGS